MQSYLNLYFYYPWLGYIFLTLIFLSVGSFLNVVIVRLPKIIFAEYEKNCHNMLKIPLTSELPKLDLVTISSHCVHCHGKIPFWYNVPALGFLVLRGKCANCKGKIAWQYPLIEILTAIFSLAAIYLFGDNWQVIYILLFIWINICLSFIDINTKLLPDCLTLSLLWLGLIANIPNLYASLPEAIYGAVCGYLSLWMVVNIYYFLTGKIGMGGGDFKLFAALGAWFGVFSLPKILICSCILGIVVGATYLYTFKKSKNTPLPFGPCLAITGMIFLFFTQIRQL